MHGVSSSFTAIQLAHHERSAITGKLLHNKAAECYYKRGTEISIGCGERNVWGCDMEGRRKAK